MVIYQSPITTCETDQFRYIPPHLDREKSNVTNSENTTLFLVSCYEYILSGIVLSVGPPFRQAMGENCTQFLLFLCVSC